MQVIAWNVWIKLPQVELWEAVALVLNINPDGLETSPNAWMHVGLGRPSKGPYFLDGSFPSADKRKEFDKALAFAERATNVAGPIFLRIDLAVGMNKRKALVSLSDVVMFFRSCDWPNVSPTLLSFVANSAEAAQQPSEDIARTQAMPKSSVAPWLLNKPERCDGLATPIYRVLQKAHSSNLPLPTARDVLESFRVQTPTEIVKVMFDSCDYLDRRGEVKSANLESIRKRIGQMTGG